MFYVLLISRCCLKERKKKKLFLSYSIDFIGNSHFYHLWVTFFFIKSVIVLEISWKWNKKNKKIPEQDSNKQLRTDEVFEHKKHKKKKKPKEENEEKKLFRNIKTNLPEAPSRLNLSIVVLCYFYCCVFLVPEINETRGRGAIRASWTIFSFADLQRPHKLPSVRFSNVRVSIKRT